MKNISNQVQLIGRLGAKPEMIKLDSGNNLAKLSLATKEVYKKGKLAENMVTYLEKGQEVAVNGKITYKSYVNKEGRSVNYTEIVANEFMMVGNKRKSNPETAPTQTTVPAPFAA